MGALTNSRFVNPRSCAVGCALTTLALAGTVSVLVIKGCPGEVARWTNRPEGRIVIRPGMTKEQVQRESTIRLGTYGDSGRFIDVDLPTEGLVLHGIEQFRCDTQTDGRVDYVTMFGGNESWPELLRVAIRTEESLLANGWHPETGQASIRSLTRDPREAARRVTESGEIGGAHFVYRKGKQRFTIAPGGEWSGIPFWSFPSRARVFWRNMDYYPLDYPFEPEPHDPTGLNRW